MWTTWGYLYAHGLWSTTLFRDNLIAGGIAVALAVGFVLGVLLESAEHAPHQALGGGTPGDERRAA